MLRKNNIWSREWSKTILLLAVIFFIIGSFIFIFISPDLRITGLIVFNDTNQTELLQITTTYQNGSFSFTSIDKKKETIILDLVDHGSFTSDIISVKNNSSYSITWTEGTPYGEQLPNNKKVENVLGGANMSENVLLLHLNNNPLRSTKDSSNERNHGSCFKNTCPDNAEGKFGNSYNFDGLNDAIDIPYAQSLNFTNSLTIEAWVYIDKFSAFDSIFGQPWTSFNEPYTTYGLALADNNNFYMGIATNGERVMCTTEVDSAPENEWIHIVGIWDGIEIKTYINGELSGQPCIKTGIIDSIDMPVYLGYYPFGDDEFLFNGRIDELAVYNRNLNEEEVIDHYKRGINNLNITVRICDDNNCEGEVWQKTYLRPVDNIIKTENNTYMQYKAFLSTENINHSPELYNVSISHVNITSLAEEEIMDDPVTEVEVRDRNSRRIRSIKRRYKDSVELDLEDHVIKKIKLRGLKKGITKDLRIDEVNISRFVQSYAIDPTNLQFTDGNVTVTAQGTVLYKCKAWDFDNRTCNGSWEEFMSITPGQNYTFTLTPDDPAFGEGIKVLTIQSYPTINGNWTVEFTTNGTDNLTITAINGTTWSNETENEDLKFLVIKCGNQTLSYEWIDNLNNNSVYIENYGCNETSSETSKVLTYGDHTLFFQFGNTTAFAYNAVAPAIDAVILNTTSAQNSTTENLTAFFINATDGGDNTSLKNITDWRVNNSSDAQESIAVLNMPFEGGSSSSTQQLDGSTKDYSTHGNNGTVMLGATFNSTGGYDGFGAYEFDGIDQLINAGSASSLDDTTELTMMAWIYPINLDAQGYNIIVNKDVYWRLSLLVNQLSQVRSIINYNVTAAESVSTDTIPINQWTHVAMTYSESGSRNITLYINGNEASYGTRTASVGSFDTGMNARSVRIGDGVSAGQTFNGSLDEVMIFNRSLSANQISLLYNNRTDVIHSNETVLGENWTVCAIPTNGSADGAEVCSNSVNIVNYIPSLDVVLNATSVNNLTSDNLTVFFANVTDLDGENVKNITDWRVNNSSDVQESIAVLNMPFEGGSNSTFTKDYSTHGNNGTVINATFNSTGGHGGFGAYEFDGDGDYIDINAASSLNITTSGTICAWINPNNAPQTLDYIITRGSGSGLTALMFSLDGASGGLRFVVKNASSTTFGTAATPAITIGRWYHDCGVYNGTHINLFINGSQFGSPVAVGGDLLTTNNVWGIGSSGTGQVAGRFFNGTIDDVRIYNRALSANQISLLYNNRTDVIHSNETNVGENWTLCVTPNDKIEDGNEVCSNSVTIVNYIPSLDVVLNATTVNNLTSDNLTAFFANVTDLDGENVKNITDWRVNNSSNVQESIAVLNMPFEGGSTSGTASANGSTKDYSTSNRVGTALNETTFNSTGGHDGFGAYDFDGTGDHAINFTGSGPKFNYTYAAWVKIKEAQKGTIIQEWGSNIRDSVLRVDNTRTVSFTVDTNASASGGDDIITSTTVLDLDTWYHVVGVRNATDMLLYVNSTLENFTFVNNSSVSSGGAFGRIGSSGGLGNGGQFNGSIDEVMIFNRSLSPDQVALLFNNRTDIIHSEETEIGDNWTVCATPNDKTEDGSEVCSNSVTIINYIPSLDVVLNATTVNNFTSDNLTAFFANVTDLDGDNVKNITDWRVNNSSDVQESIAVLNMPFEGGSSSGVPGTDGFTKDYSTHGNNGTVVNATFNSTGGHDGFGAYSFDGDSGKVKFTGNGYMFNYTYAAWVKVQNYQDTVRGTIIQEWWNNYRASVLRVEFWTGRFGFVIDDKNNQAGTLITSTTTLSLNEWYYIVGVRNTSHILLYVNGVLENTSTVNSSTSTGGGNGWIGGGGGLSNGGDLNGSLDDVKIYNRALSSQQILALYNNRSDLIVSQETSIGENWTVCVTPNDKIEDGNEVCSNSITVQNDTNNIPSLDVILNTTNTSRNDTRDNLTAFFANVTDLDGDNVKNITDWRVNNSSDVQESIAVLNMPFEAGSNSTFTKDYSTHGNNGTVVNATFNSTGGHDGFGAYSFDGEDDYIEGYNIPNEGANANITITAWIRPAAVSGLRNIFTKGRSGICFNYGMILNGNILANRNSVANSDLGGVISADNWHHVAVIYNSTGSNGYIDGTFVGSNTLNTTSCGYLNWTIGVRAFNSLTEDFNGSIDEVMVFNRSLSPNQISLLYNNRTDVIHSNETNVGENWTLCVTPNDKIEDGSEVCSNSVTIINYIPSLDVVLNTTNTLTNSTVENLTVFFANVTDLDGDNVKNITDWRVNNSSGAQESIAVLNMPFEGGSNSTFTKDYSNQGNNGTVRNAAFNSTGGYDGFGAYEFNGSNNDILLGDDSLNDMHNGTIVAWIKIVDDGTTKTIFSSAQLNNSGTFIEFQVDGGKELAINGRFNGVNQYVGIVTSPLITNNNWTHVAWVKNGTGHSIYINGVNSSSVSLSPTTNLDFYFDDMSGATTVGNTIGKLRHLIEYQHFNGTIDEFMIFNRSLSANQISLLYNNRTDVIHSDETSIGENWTVCVTPNDKTEDGNEVCSNSVTIVNYIPSLDVVLNATTVNNLTSDNLTVFFANVTDLDGENVKNITDWRVNNSSDVQESIAVLNMPFEGGSNSTFTKDYSTYKNNGTVTNAVFNSTGGYDGLGAYEFDEGNRINLSSQPNLIQGFTFSAWVKRRSDASNSLASQNIFNNNQFFIRALNENVDPNNPFEAFVVLNDSSVEPRASSNVPATIGEWFFITVTWNMSDLQIYINGSLKGTSSRTGNLTSITASPQIGRGQLTGDTDPWNGTIDEVKFFNRVLSPNQISLLYNNRTDVIHSDETSVGENWTVAVTPNDGNQDGTTVISNSVTIVNAVPSLDVVLNTTNTLTNSTVENLTAFFANVTDLDGDNVKNITDWRVNNSSGAQESILLLNMPFEGNSSSGIPSLDGFTKDYSTHGNNGTVVNATFNSTGGHGGFGAYEFDGDGDYIDLNDADVMNFTNISNFTIVAWFNKKNDSVINSIFDKFASQGYRLYLDDTGRLIFQIRNQSSSLFSVAPTQNLVPNDVWTYVAATFTAGGDMILYKNGTQIGTGTPTVQLAASSQTPKIGYAPNNAAYFNGTIDEVMVFNRSLSANQIALLYNNRTDVIHSDETSIGENWTVCVTPTDKIENGNEVCSNSVNIMNATNNIPSLDVILNTTNTSRNDTRDNLTAFFANVTDLDGENVKNITDWRINNDSSQESIAVLNMPFEGGSNSTFTKDYSTHGNNGTVNSATFNSTGGHDGFGAYSFDGSITNVINLSSQPNLTQGFTFSAWVKRKSDNAFSNSQTIFNNNQFFLRTQPESEDPNNPFEAFVTLDDASVGPRAGSTVPATIGEWFFVTVTWNKINLSIYVDGIFKVHSIRTGNLTNTVADPQIGRGQQTSNTLGQWNGTIDEVKFFNRVLSPNQISLLYNNRTDIIHSNETSVGDNWTVCVTPTDKIEDGNEVCSNSVNITGETDLRPFNLSFSNDNPAENESTIINATILNNGTSSASSIDVQFFDGNCSAGTGAQINGNQTIASLASGESVSVNVTFNASPVGPHNITVCVDPSDVISEDNETNNVERKEMDVQAYTTYFGPLVGNVTLERVTNNETLYRWSATDTGNLFFADSDVTINFENLQAIGINSSGTASTNDFSEVDTVLNMTGFNDSVESKWGLNASAGKQVINFTVLGKTIFNVSIINSTNNTNFLTGILWDTTNDSNGEFDSSDKEDLVFVAKINRSQAGFNGTLDYEADIPVLLRSFNLTTEQLKYYLELR